jgi:aldehyde dehydrogenase (NAD+)
MCKIINQRNYDRLASLLGKTKGKIAYGGHCSAATLTMSLTVVTDVTLDDSLMSEELFGPICPVIKADYQTAIRTINS